MDSIVKLLQSKKEEPKLTLDSLFGNAENDKTYIQYMKLKELERINIIKIPGHEKSFMFDKMDFEPKAQIYCDTKVIVEHYRYKPTNTEMAVKFLRIPFSNDVSKFDSFFNKIQQEMYICKELPSSLNLVELYGFCIYGGYILICMEYMDMSLYDLYKQFHQQHGRFPHDLLGIMAVSVVDAIRDLKSKNIMHRNIKPQKILINKQGQIKLCDFGVSRFLVDSHATTVTGTPMYWPPERFDLKYDKYDIRADVWSLGITLLELSGGKHPYGIDAENSFFKSIALILEALTKLDIEETIPQELPNSLKEFIKNCLLPFDARPSSTQLISSSLYKDYKEIAQAVVVETILYLEKIVDVQPEINNMNRALTLIKKFPKFEAGLASRLVQILQESHFEIDANESDILKHISIIEALIAICKNNTDSYKTELSKSGIYDTLLLIIEKSIQIQKAHNNDMSRLLEKAACLLRLITEEKQNLLKNENYTVKEKNAPSNKGYAKNDQTKLNELEGINCIKIPRYKNSFMFDITKFEFKDHICVDAKVKLSHFHFKPTKTEMAVKFLRIQFSKHDESIFELFFNKIKREMDICKKLPSSPNLVKLYGFCIYDGYILICMECMDMSLYNLYTQFHQQHGRFPNDLLGIIAVSVVDALKDLTSASIIHRDIKPKNILINKQGQIKLCDFGISRILVDSHANTSTGTALYLPPERFDPRNVKYDIRDDIWSLGITLLELSKGKHPYGIDEENVTFYALLNEALTKLDIEETIPQELPNSLKEFIKNCLLPFDARPSSTQLISSSLYKDYKEIAQAVVVETILYLEKIVDVQPEINNMNRALTLIKKFPKFEASLVQILQEIDANAS